MHVEGCHWNYRPKLVSIEAGFGRLRTMLGEHLEPLSKLYLASDWDRWARVRSQRDARQRGAE